MEKGVKCAYLAMFTMLVNKGPISMGPTKVFVLLGVLGVEEIQCNLAEKQVCDQEARENNI